MRLRYFLLAALTTGVAFDNTLGAVSPAEISRKVASDLAPHDDLAGVAGDNTRMLRIAADGDDRSDDLALGQDKKESDDDEDRDLIISTVDRPKYRRWFRAGMTPYDVQQVLGLTKIRRLWKPIKRRRYKGYVVYYTEHCQKQRYRAFCRAHADK